MLPNIKAFLDMIAWAEIGQEMLAQSDNGYNVLAGSVPDMVITFSSYHRHPGFLVDMDGKPGGLQSTAAGRYQFLSRYYPHYKKQLGLRGFYPDDQDRWAVQLIKECRAYDKILAGDIESGIHLCRSRWASFPAAGYGQPQKTLTKMLDAYSMARAKKQGN